MDIYTKYKTGHTKQIIKIRLKVIVLICGYLWFFNGRIRAKKLNSIPLFYWKTIAAPLSVAQSVRSSSGRLALHKEVYLLTLTAMCASNPSIFFCLVITNDTSCGRMITRHIGHRIALLGPWKYAVRWFCSRTTHLQHKQCPHLKTAHWKVKTHRLASY